MDGLVIGLIAVGLLLWGMVERAERKHAEAVLDDEHQRLRTVLILYDDAVTAVQLIRALDDLPANDPCAVRIDPKAREQLNDVVHAWRRSW